MDETDRRRLASAAASRWFALLQSDQMRRDEREQFIDWLRESPLHVAEMLRIVDVHGALEQFNLWTEIATGPKSSADDDSVIRLEPRAAAPAPTERPVRNRVRLVAGIAGAFALVAVFSVLFLTRGQVIDTDRGERREVVLADGSVLQVDPETRVRVKYTDALRELFLERGRAMFHVTRNSLRPFVVHSDGTTVRVIGTTFGVERQGRKVVVTVADGKVAIMAALTPTTPDSHQLTAPANPARDRAARHSDAQVLLTANQQVTVQASGSAEPVQEVDSQQALAWAEGRLIFHNDTIETAIRQFNRYNRVQMTVANPALAAHPINGVFNASQPNSFIAFLQSVAAIRVVRDGDRSITLLAAGTDAH